MTPLARPFSDCHGPSAGSDIGLYLRSETVRSSG